MQEGEGGDDLVTAVKVHTTYRYNDKGEVEKVVKRVRTVTRRTVRPLAVLERAKGIPKFGEALNGNKDTTKASTDDVSIELPGANAEKDVLQILKESSTGGVSAPSSFDPTRVRAAVCCYTLGHHPHHVLSQENSRLFSPTLPLLSFSLSLFTHIHPHART